MKPFKMISKVVLACTIFVAGVSVPNTARTAAITGDLNITGTLSLTSTSGLNFLPPVAAGGQFTTGASTGTFATLAETSGTIDNIDLMPGPVDVPGFLTLGSAPSIQFRLTSILTGIFSLSQCGAPPLVAQQCSPAIPGVGLSALSFLNTQHGSTLSFEMEGTFLNTVTGDITPYAGLFTAQFAQRYQDVFAGFQNGHSITTTYSATFQQIGAPIPESHQATLLGVGFAALWIIRLRKELVGKAATRHASA